MITHSGYLYKKYFGCRSETSCGSCDNKLFSCHVAVLVFLDVKISGDPYSMIFGL